MGFVKATKKQAKLRLNLSGPAGAGKTYSALAIASGLGGKVALVDTERGSASKYADKFDFDVEEIYDDYNPKRLMATLDQAALGKYDVVVVDSLSHFWNGKGGFLDLVDAEVQDMKNRGNKPDSFAAWKKITPIYNSLIQKLLGFPGHLICTARAKMDYEKQTEGGKTKVVKIGLAPELREGWQYEFDVEGTLTDENVLVVGKTRCPELKGKTFPNPGADVANILKRWLDDGAVAPETPVAQPVQQPANDSGLEDKVRRCLAEIAGAKNREALEAIGQRIARAPVAFQQAVEPAYALRESEMKKEAA